MTCSPIGAARPSPGSTAPALPASRARASHARPPGGRDRCPTDLARAGPGQTQTHRGAAPTPDSAKADTTAAHTASGFQKLSVAKPWAAPLIALHIAPYWAPPTPAINAGSQ